MIRWVQLGAASVPGGGGELRLMQRGTEFSIFAGATELMSSRLSGSEEALASITCARMLGRPAPHVLIGGLGMGFTLRTALAILGTDATVTLAELVPEVVAWARGPLAAIHGDSLSDPRLKIFEGDVGDLIAGASERYDAILLDVDNGPAGLTRDGNDDLYDAYGLGEARKALRPGGALAVWSATPDPAFEKRLHATGFSVEDHRVRANARGRGGARHVIWLATKKPPSPSGQGQMA
jgi:spermidine synthase